jgi:hypothetical protein
MEVNSFIYKVRRQPSINKQYIVRNSQLLGKGIATARKRTCSCLGGELAAA